MTSFFRVIKFALQDIMRNFSLSFMTVLILVLMLLSVNTLIVMRVLTSEAILSIKNKIDVSVFFSHDATDQKIAEVQKFIQSFREVVTTTFSNRDDVLRQFKAHYAQNPEILASLDEIKDNPLGSTLIVKTREPNDYEKIMKALKVPEYEDMIEAKTFADTEKAINRIHTITTEVEKISFTLIVLFAFIAFLIIFNTIRVAIYTQRVEINIKKLVGATNWFVRGPFLVESFVFSVFSVCITLVIVWFSLRFLDPYMAVIFTRDSILTNYFLSNILMLLGGQFAAVFILTLLSSSLAIAKHLRV